MTVLPAIPPDPANVGSLLPYAILAPSSHNTQPWYFQVNERRISIYADRTRALPVNDPDDRELTISCGCALMNVRIAAAKAGLAADPRLQPDNNDSDLLAIVDFKDDTVNQAEAELFSAIAGRRTYRKRFDRKDVPSETLKSLAEAASQEGAWIQVIDSDKARHDIAALVAEGDAIQWSNSSWRRELAAWMHPRRRGDGLVVPGLIAPIAQLVVRTFDMGNGIGAKDKQLADESPVLAVLGTNGDDVIDWLKAGQALECVILTAYRNGLQASYLNQPIQVPSLRPKLQPLVGHAGFPQILLRLGFPTEELPAAPRRHLDEVVD